MALRLNYMGGKNQQERMNKDKLKSLKKALLYSYQAATAVLSDGREFRCLINPNKLSVDLDNKILSIPFKDICLNEDRVGTTPQGEVDTNIKEGDVIEWKENGSHWIVYLRRLEETAYFRAELRRCRNELVLENNSKYWVYIKGPVEKDIDWIQGGGNYINKLNYTLTVYISQTEETLAQLHRFSKVTINNQTWEVQSVDSISTPGLLEVSLKETYNNTIETDLDRAVENSENHKENDCNTSDIAIVGPTLVYPYDTHVYELKNYSGSFGFWKILNETKERMVNLIPNELLVRVEILTGKQGSFSLAYEVEGHDIAIINIAVDSL